MLYYGAKEVPYVDLGRVWQIALFVVLLLWFS